MRTENPRVSSSILSLATPPPFLFQRLTNAVLSAEFLKSLHGTPALSRFRLWCTGNRALREKQPL